MRILLALAATTISSAAFAHSGHGEIDAMHHGIFSPLNGLEPLAAVAAGVALIAYAVWKRS
jgi:hydrogenase/urease accessory protein HupE